MKRLFYIFISLFICLFSTSCDFETRDYSGTYTFDMGYYGKVTLTLENIKDYSNSKGRVKYEGYNPYEQWKKEEDWGSCEWLDYKGLLWIKLDNGPFLYINTRDLNSAYDGEKSTIYIFKDVDAAEIYNLQHPECYRCKVRFSKRK